MNRAGPSRGFDKDAALAAALLAFWQRGFDGVSIDDLTAAMGISRPTLYAVFGNKATLFVRALDHYERGEAAFYRDAVDAATAKGVAEYLLRGAVDMFYRGSNPPVCLYVSHLMAFSNDAAAVRAEVLKRTQAGDAALGARFERAVREGDLPAATDVVGTVHFLTTLVQGLAVQASSGVPREVLEGTIESALCCWPFGARPVAASRTSRAPH